MKNGFESRMTRVDRSLARAIDEAVRLERWPIARRLVEASCRLETRSTALCAGIARARAGEGALEAALRALDAAPRATPQILVLRAHILIRMGRKAEAHLDLARLRRKSSLPGAGAPATEGLRLLALLEAEAGRGDEAIAILNDLAAREDDSQTLQCLLLLHKQRGETLAVEEVAARLRRLMIFPDQREEIELFLGSLGLTRNHSSAAALPPHGMVREVAEDLAHSPPLISTLLAAQRASFDAGSARLLCHALISLAEDGCDDAETHAAIVELMLRLDGAVAAEAWLERAHRRHPMSATLMRLREELSRDRTAAGLRGDSSNSLRPNADGVIASIGPRREEAA